MSTVIFIAQNLHHHYRSLGGWTFAFDAYYQVKFTADVDNPSTQKMATYIDPLGESKQINVRQYRRGNQKWTVSEKQDDEKQNKNTTQYVLDTTMRKQTQITSIRYEPSYKQLEVKTKRTSFLCGNRNGHHNTELRRQTHKTDFYFKL